MLYVEGELAIPTVQDRLRELGPTPDNLAVLSMEYLAQCGAILPDLGTPEGQEFFDRAFAEYKPDLVIMDPLTVCVPINSSERRHDGGRQGQAMTRSARSSELGDESDNLCPRIDVSVPDYSCPYRKFIRRPIARADASWIVPDVLRG